MLGSIPKYIFKKQKHTSIQVVHWRSLIRLNTKNELNNRQLAEKRKKGKQVHDL